MKPMQAGKRDYFVRFEYNAALATATDKVGSPTESWQLFRKTWASIEPMAISGREPMYGAMVSPDMTHKITVAVNNAKPLTTKMRMVWRNRIFELGAVANTEEQDRELIIFAKEQV